MPGLGSLGKSSILPDATNKLAATGGTQTIVNGYMVHTFTSAGTFTVISNPTSAPITYCIVAGGGGGGGGESGNSDGGAGGGGAGGGVLLGNVALAIGQYTVTIGGGGASGGANATGSNGTNSTFLGMSYSLTAFGGGGGARDGNFDPGSGYAGSGGCGGGGGGDQIPPGRGTQGQGYEGAPTGGGRHGGGGGGAGKPGVSNASGGGNGGDGNLFNGVYYGGGGGGGAAGNGGPQAGAGGAGGGGAGLNSPGNALANQSGAPTAGTANTGGGGGGQSPGRAAGGATGGSGICIVTYPLTFVELTTNPDMTFASLSTSPNEYTLPSNSGPYVCNAVDIINQYTLSKYAFDKNLGTYWFSSSGLTTGSGFKWLSFSYPSKVLVTKYTLYSRPDSPADIWAPYTWQFQGSNDNSTWTTLDTKTGVTFQLGATYSIDLVSNTTLYQHYRIYVTAARQTPTSAVNGDFVCIAELILTTYPIFEKTFLPTTLSGLVGWYDTSSWTGSQWTDTSGSGNHAVTITGTIGYTTINGSLALAGSTTGGIRFPVAILPATFTLFHVARYNGSTQARIFDGVAGNWLNGFWGGFSGVAYHNGWLTQSVASAHGQNWVISSSTNTTLRSNFSSRTTGAPGAPSYAQLTINTGAATTERSDWAVAEVIVYNRTLTIPEIIAVETYLANKYNLQNCLDIPSNGLIMYLNIKTRLSWPGSGRVWYDLSGNNRHGTWSAVSTDSTSLGNPYFVTSASNQCTGQASNSYNITDTSGYTIFITYRKPAASQNDAFFFSGNGEYTIGIKSHLPWNEGTIFFDQAGNSTTARRLTYVPTAGTLYTNWHTVAFVRTAGATNSRYIYYDGALGASTAVTGDSLQLNSTTATLADHAGWNAYISSMVIYNRELTAAEIVILNKALLIS